MMSERRFRGDIRIGPARLVTFQDGGVSPDLRRTSGSPTLAMTQGRSYLLPYHEFRERHSQFDPALSSIYREMEKSRLVLGSDCPSALVERIEHSGHLDGDRPDSDRKLRRYPDFNEGLLQRDSHLDGDRDWNLRKRLQIDEVLSQTDSPTMKFHRKHLLEEPGRMIGNVNHSSKNFPDYGFSLNSPKARTEKECQGVGVAEMGRSGMIVKKPILLEIERDKTFPPYPSESGIRRSSADIDGDNLLFSKKLDISHHKDEDLRFQYCLRADKLSADELSAKELYLEKEILKFYTREDNPQFYSRDTSHYLIPPSQPKASTTVPFRSSIDDFHHSVGDSFPVDSDRLNRSSGMLTEPIDHEAYAHVSHLKSSQDLNLLLENETNFRQVQLSPNESTCRGYTYPEVQRSEKSEMGVLPDKVYGKLASVHDDFGYQDSLGTRIMEPVTHRMAVAESSCIEHMIGGRLWDHHHSSQEQPISSYLDAAGYATDKNGQGLVQKSMHLENEREIYQGHGNIYLGEDHVYESDDGLQSNEELSNMLLMADYNPFFDEVDNNYQEGLTVEEFGSLELPRRMLKRKRDVDKKLTRRNPGSKFLTNRKISGKIHDSKSNKSLLNASRYRNRTSSERGGHRKYNSAPSSIPLEYNPRHLKSTVRDIKKRLGPVQPAPQHVHIPQSSVKKYKLHKFLRINQDGYHVEEQCSSEDNLTLVKSEPPENSEDFKQLVHNAYVKFVKQLNENPAKHKRFKEHGNAGSLKCSVCGRSSEEFLNTQSLVIHACMAPKVGFRAQHLGFHKALCLLMGWKSAEILNSQWVCQVLPDPEAVAMKEDLIIWPPVVLFHNTSIGNSYPDEHVVVSVEMLEAMLRDMGFGEKTKVCGGKPANQSIMLVKFIATFSGLQAAERLDKFYADSKRGRSEFMKINPNGCSIGDLETQKASANTMKDVLYGYLGIAEDLDKLDFETKKRCWVRSRKAILNIADASLRT